MSLPLVAAPTSGPAGNFITNISTNVAQQIFSVSSGTVSQSFNLPYITPGQCTTVNSNGQVVGTPCGSGAASVAVTTGSSSGFSSVTSSPTAVINFDSNTFTTALKGGATVFVALSGNYLTTSSATATYLQQSSATATYLQTSSATATYLQQSSATVTYFQKTAIIPVANGGTGTPSPGLVAGTNTSITGSWPNQTINNTSIAGNPAGLTSQVQFNYAGSFAGSSTFTTDGSSVTVSTMVAGNYVINGGSFTSNNSAGTFFYNPAFGSNKWYFSGYNTGLGTPYTELLPSNGGTIFSGTFAGAGNNSYYLKNSSNQGVLLFNNNASPPPYFSLDPAGVGFQNGQAGSNSSAALLVSQSSSTFNQNVVILSSEIINENGVSQISYPASPLIISGSTNTYFQNVIQNFSNGNNASVDYIATSNLGGDTSYYMDLGINGAGYNQASYSAIPSSWSYLYSSDAGLAIWAGTNGTDSKSRIVFGTSNPVTANQWMVIYSTGQIQTYGNINVSSGILLSGSAGTSGQTLTSGGPGTIPTWTTISGAGGSSTLAVTTGSVSGWSTIASSPTAVINFSSNTFNVTLQGGATAFVQLQNVNACGYVIGSQVQISSVSDTATYSTTSNSFVRGTTIGLTPKCGTDISRVIFTGAAGGVAATVAEYLTIFGGTSAGALTSNKAGTGNHFSRVQGTGSYSTFTMTWEDFNIGTSAIYYTVGFENSDGLTTVYAPSQATDVTYARIEEIAN